MGRIGKKSKDKIINRALIAVHLSLYKIETFGGGVKRMKRIEKKEKRKKCNKDTGEMLAGSPAHPLTTDE